MAVFTMKYDSLPPDYKGTFSRHVGAMKFIGMKIFHDSNDRYIGWKKRLIIFNIIFIPFMCGQISLIAQLRPESFVQGARTVPVLVLFTLDLVKMTIAVVKRSELNDMLLEIGELWPIGLRETAGKGILMKKWTQQKLFKAFYLYNIIQLVIFDAMPLLVTSSNLMSGSKVFRFPFAFLGLWEVTDISSFVATYVWELVSTIPCQVCVYLSFDMLIVAHTSNVSMLLRLLQHDLENAVKTHDENGIRKNDLHLSDPEGYQEICRIIRIHQRLLSIADQTSKIFSLVIFVHVSFAAVIISFFAFLVVSFGGIGESIKNVMAVWKVVFSMFVLAVAGQQLSDTSSGIAEAAYNCQWYESDKRVRKLVLFIIARAQKPNTLSALGFSDLTLISFSEIMSSAYTYFSLLVTIYEF